MLQQSQPVKIPKQTLGTEVSETFDLYLSTIYISDMAWCICYYLLPAIVRIQMLEKGDVFCHGAAH